MVDSANAPNDIPHPQEEPPQEQDTSQASPGMEELLAQAQQEAQKFKDQWIRAVAEADNIRKRAQRDIEDSNKYAISSFAREIVSVLENLTRASESMSPEQRAASELVATVATGVDLTLNELLAIFDRYGIKRIEPLGQKFDHNLHQAVVQVPSTDVEPGTVVQVLQAGYTLHDRLLRPAMVAVSKAETAPAKAVDTNA